MVDASIVAGYRRYDLLVGQEDQKDTKCIRKSSNLFLTTLKRVTAYNDTNVMATQIATKKLDVQTLAERITKWNKDLKVEFSKEGDSVIASAKHIDVDSYDLEALAAIIGNDYKVTFGRSGANFRMIIW